MRKFILYLFASMLAVNVFSQSCEMPLRVVIPEQVEPLSAIAEQQLKNKLRNLVVKNGIVGGFDASPFAITASVDVINEEVISGMPTKYVYVLNVNLFIVNIQDKKIFSSASVEVRTAGNSGTKAYASGIQKLSASNAEVRSCIEIGKQKMLDYYDSNYSNIIKQAKSLAVLKNYEEALYMLMAVPVCCNGYDACMEEVKDIYQQYVDRQCDENLAQAQAAWMSGFTKENATIASGFLAEILPDAACYGKAQALADEIKKHMGEEWQFEMKQWDDAMSVEAQKMEHSREIALAFAQNQPNQAVSFIF